MGKRIRRLFCWLGFHSWMYVGTHARECWRCGAGQICITKDWPEIWL